MATAMKDRELDAYLDELERKYHRIATGGTLPEAAVALADYFDADQTGPSDEMAGQLAARVKLLAQ